jgi:creatinine amidohydrolase
MRAGARTFRECGMADAYCGAPAAATATEGERLYAILTEILAEAAAP